MKPLHQRVVAAASLADRLIRPILPIWFAVLTTSMVATHLAVYDGTVVGVDARIYHRGVVAYLNGANPWDTLAYMGPWPAHFTGLPPTILTLLPLALLPEEIVVWLLLPASFAAGLFIVRNLHLPWYFVLFPPLVQGMMAANPHLLLMALVLAGWGWLSPLVKVYFIAPLVAEKRWRQLFLCVLLIAISVLVAPQLWIEWLSRAGFISTRILEESLGGHSAVNFGPPMIVPIAALLALFALVDWRAAGWIAVPALWPATQFFYSTFFLPVMRPWMAMILSLEMFGMAPLVAAIATAVAVAEYLDSTPEHARSFPTIDRVRSRWRPRAAAPSPESPGHSDG